MSDDAITTAGDPMGKPIDRRDGPAKVTGRARYTGDFAPDQVLHAVLVPSTIARGRITGLDTRDAEAVPGVVLVMTHLNALRLADSGMTKEGQSDFKLALLQDDAVRYARQPVGVVLGETLEAATWGAQLVRPDYQAEAPRMGMDQPGEFSLQKAGQDEADAMKGDPDAALAAAATRTEPVYTTPHQTHNPMEPHATLARWAKDGEGNDQLTLWTATQGLYPTRKKVAKLLGIAPDKIRVVCYFSGGGFGSKGPTWSHVVLAAMAAKMTGRPVKLVLERTQMFGPIGHRAPTRQAMRLGAGADGKLAALSHHTLAQTSSFDEFTESSSLVSRTLYATPALSSTHSLVRADVGTPSFMRAPGQASGNIVLESAVDETAFALGLDPLEFRLRNYADAEPLSGKPYSSKSLRQCYEQGAARFVWAGGRCSHGRCRTRTGCSSAGASARRPIPRTCGTPRRGRASSRTGRRWSSRRPTTWARGPGPAWCRPRRARSACRWSACDLSWETLAIRTGASPVVPAPRRARARRSTPPARRP